MSERIISHSRHSCAQQYRACHHFPQESNEWEIVVVKFHANLLAVNLLFSRLKLWKLSYSKMDV
jgi:hypothetical protein